jgi:PAS domain S-box-containing protein
MNSVPFNKNRRVLVVDDNRAIHDDFRKILSPPTATVVALDAMEKALFGHSKDAIPQTQFEVDSAYQGQEGVLLVKKALEAGLPYAMAFVDVRMPPGWDGVETTRKIWELDPDLQIVLCTAYSDYSWDEMFEKLGHHDGLLILKKPFDVVEAFQLAHALTEKWWLHQQSVRKMEELESRVAERTRELQQTNHALQMEVAEHERAEETLRASEERYRSLFESNPNPMWVYDLETLSFLAVNAAAIRHYGYSQDEFLAMTIKDIRPREDIPTLMDDLSQETDGLDNLTQWRHCKKNGALIDVEVTSHELTWLGRRAKVVLIIDITERKLSDEAIRASEQRFSSFMDNVPGFAWMKDAEGRYVYANKLVQELLLFGREWRGRTAEEVWPPEIAAALRANDEKIIETKAPLQIVEMVVQSGEKRSVLSSKFPMLNENGEVAFVCGVGIDITERNRAEEGLKLFRSLIDQSNDAIEVVDPETGRFLDANERACTDLGYTREEFLSLKVSDIDPVVDQSAFPRAVEELRKSGFATLESLHKRKDGSTFPVEINLKYVRLDRDYLVTVVRDATERKRGEEVLRASEEKYRGLFETMQEGFALCEIICGDDGTPCDFRFLEANPAFEEILGVKRAQAISKTVREIFPQIESYWIDTYGKVALSGVPVRFENYLLALDKYFEVVAFSPKRGQFAAVFTDITERRLAEGRLREQADIINRAQDAIIILNFENQRITFWNSGAERLYGWSADDATGRSICELIFQDPKDCEGLLEVLASAGEFHGEIKQVAKDGREIIAQSRATLIRNPDGTAPSGLLINTDVTGQKKLETQLLRAQRLESIGTLASGVAHDLNNILAPILMCAQTLRDNLDAEDRQSAISLIEDSAQRGASVVKQVLTFARGIEGERVLIQPTHLIEEMIDIARQTFPKSIELTGRYPEDLWTIQGDPTQLHQVLLNLSVNARDAMPNGGSLTLAAENFTIDENYAAMTPDARVGPYVILRVTDSGTGMPRATADKIFDPFFTTKEIGKGTGLGLSTVLGIVKSHGGFISVYSEIGQGTTFKIFFPATMSDEDLKKSRTAAAPMQGNGEQILVVDDEPNILRITKMIFERHNYRVVSASDGTEALALFAQQMDSIGGVLTDISMPYMDGVALVRALRKMKSDIPIIASTGQGDEPGLAVLQSLGVKNFLTKPYNAQTLLTTLRDTLSGTPGNPVERLQSRS